MSYGYDRFLFLFINEVPVCYLSFRKDSLFCRKQTEQLMKILHTADWHLGQTFYEYDRREEHFHFLEWLKQQIKQHEIDVLLIAGDVFDSPNPSAESQRVYYRF